MSPTSGDIYKKYLAQMRPDVYKRYIIMRGLLFRSQWNLNVKLFILYCNYIFVCMMLPKVQCIP